MSKPPAGDAPAVFELDGLSCPASHLDEGERLTVEAGLDAFAWMNDPKRAKRLSDKKAVALLEAIEAAKGILLAKTTPPAAKPSARKAKEGTDAERKRALRPQTDLGNAERFVDRCGSAFRWCPEIGWLAWDGRRWNMEDAATRAMIAVFETIRAIQDEAKAIAGTKLDVVVSEKTSRKPAKLRSQSLAEWGRSSESQSHIEACRRLAAPMLAARPDAFDADPMLLTVENGTLAFSKPGRDDEADDCVKLRPHDPAQLITKLAPVTFDPTATAPQFHAFLEGVMPDPLLRRFLAQWFGYGLTGLTGEQRLVFCYGKGANGKSTLVDVLAAVFGDYSDTIPIETFLDQGKRKRGSDATPDLVQLKGVRFLRTSEPERNATLAEAFIKLVTGGEPLKVRELNSPFFVMRPSFKLTISGNHRPEVKGADEGIWRRLLLVPFLVIVEKAKRDPDLPRKLIAEKAGIFNWLLDGLRDYLDNGLVVPEVIVAATKDYRDDSDPLGRFLEICTRETPGARTQSSDLYLLFVAWAKAAGEREWSNKGLSMALKERGFRAINSSRIYWVDLEMVKLPSDFGGLDAPPADRPFADRETYPE